MSYPSREKYHCPITIINIVRTKGKAGYRDLKSAGGQGDHDISLPLVAIEDFKVFFSFNFDLSVANPLFILEKNLILTKIKKSVIGFY